LLQRTDLSVIPNDHIDRATYISLLEALRSHRPSQTWVVPYNIFQALNDKSSNLTVGNIWARMMSTFSGMSTEKVSSFLDKWPTPRDFWDAYKDRAESAQIEERDWQAAETERASQASQGTGGKSRKPKKPNPENWVAEELPSDSRGIGPALSKKIWQLYDAEEY